MGLPSFVVLCALMLIVIVVLMVIIFITSLRLSETRDDNDVLSALLEQRDHELKVLRRAQMGQSEGHHG